MTLSDLDPIARLFVAFCVCWTVASLGAAFLHLIFGRDL